MGVLVGVGRGAQPLVGRGGVGALALLPGRVGGAPGGGAREARVGRRHQRREVDGGVGGLAVEQRDLAARPAR